MAKKLVMVETISTHLVKYCVEVEENLVDALDEVICRETDSDFHEYSQHHVGVQILSHYEISKEKYLEQFDIDNDYLASWTEEQKLRFINKIDYGDENDSTNSGNEA